MKIFLGIYSSHIPFLPFPHQLDQVCQHVAEPLHTVSQIISLTKENKLMYSVLSFIRVQIIWFTDHLYMILSLIYRVFDS
jgi:hypothetical protein